MPAARWTNAGNCPYMPCVDTKHSSAVRAAPQPAAREESCSCLALREAARYISRLYDEALAPAGIGVNQYSVLAKIAHCGPCPLSELALSLVMDRSTLGHLLRPLARQGLVAITRGDDGRQRLVTLTEHGAHFVETMRPLWQKAERSFRSTFGRARAEELRGLLRAVTETSFDQHHSSLQEKG